jgi:hypothetical protein
VGAERGVQSVLEHGRVHVVEQGALGRRGLGQASGLLLASAIAGLVAAGIVQGWLGALGANWVVNAGALALTVLAVAAAAVGLAAVAAGALWHRQPAAPVTHTLGKAVARQVARQAVSTTGQEGARKAM